MPAGLRTRRYVDPFLGGEFSSGRSPAPPLAPPGPVLFRGDDSTTCSPHRPRSGARASVARLGGTLGAERQGSHFFKSGSSKLAAARRGEVADEEEEDERPHAPPQHHSAAAAQASFCRDAAALLQERARARAAEQWEAEMNELLACLGLEGAKVAALAEALRERGFDPDPMLAELEQRYE